MKQFLNKIGRNTQGNALMLLAAGLVPVTLMIGGGLDASITYSARAKLQNACDAGALAGRLAMIGTDWTTEAEDEAEKFFDFNFPSGTHGVTDAKFEIDQDPDKPSQLLGTATATVPTSIMFMFGYDEMDIAVTCDAQRDMGHNDVMLVLDVTSSMLLPPSDGGDPKITRLRTAVLGLYRALEGSDTGSITRFGFVPFSQSANIARQLQNKDIVRDQYFVDGNWTKTTTTLNDSNGVPYQYSHTYLDTDFQFTGKRKVGPRDSYYNNGQNGNATANAIIQGFRTQGDGCVEERPSYGVDYNNGEFTYSTTYTIEDINETPGNSQDEELQFGRYEPVTQKGYYWSACVSEGKQFAEYDTEDDFSDAVVEVTDRVAGGTYSDIGMLWGIRFASRDGFLEAKNPKTQDGWPVNPHLIFFTDGQIYGTTRHYTSWGIDEWQHRIGGDGQYANTSIGYTQTTTNHRERFRSLCTLAKSMGMTVWVVALDTLDNGDFQNCATSPAHFYYSTGDDLEDKFTAIGQGIGNLRLTK